MGLFSTDALNSQAIPGTQMSQFFVYFLSLRLGFGGVRLGFFHLLCHLFFLLLTTYTDLLSARVQCPST